MSTTRNITCADQCILCAYASCMHYGSVEREREMYMYIHVCVHVKYECITPGTLQRMFLCYYSPLYRSHYWGCGSAPPPGPGLHSGWLSGSSFFTVLSVIRSIDLYCPLYLLLQSMQVIYTACTLCIMRVQVM